ncbi:uncharacterized protein LOC110689108 [Chenopodium quinoa]|uniref:uncharacterized protein LOC110689108 n=1 Tax=Chenopodium quinoa TaxID=63459 RepID=UPI000B796DF7|nr:uncharacterized protein LOC110689108 [Chenopodium quinoa]
MVVCERVARLVEDCNKYATRIYALPSKKKPSSPKIWIPPPDDFVKVNCDASLKDSGWVGLIRNKDGEVLFAGTRRCRGSWPPEIAECKAVLFGIKLASRYGFKKVIIVSESQIIISRLSKAVTYFTDLDSILEDVLSICSSFYYVNWSHVRRDGNAVAHYLASLVPFGCE